MVFDELVNMKGEMSERGLLKFTTHALRRLRERGIKKDDARRILSSPFVTRRGNEEETLSYGPAVVEGRWQWIVVVAVEDYRRSVVITTYAVG